MLEVKEVPLLVNSKLMEVYFHAVMANNSNKYSRADYLLEHLGLTAKYRARILDILCPAVLATLDFHFPAGYRLVLKDYRTVVLVQVLSHHPLHNK